MQVVWFKRDLRVADHVPLEQASKQGRCICLYVYEPELSQSPEFDASHLKFINESLAELDAALHAIGGQLTYRIGRMPEVLQELHSQYGIDAIWSHQETGNRITFERDRRVRRWVEEKGLVWHEIPQHGVVRGLKSRDGWGAHWSTAMSRPAAPRPSQVVVETGIETGAPATPQQLGLDASEKTELQVGGESQAISVLKQFLHDRRRNYRNEMSSPVTAWQSCSRLSPYLTWGCISIKSIAQQLQARQAELREQKKAGKDVGPWLGSLSAFRSRLNWHCHFIQKLEDEPSIEWQNMEGVKQLGRMLT